MEPEWDCLAQILDSLKIPQHNAPPIHHVKGHQDDETLYKQLPLNAQLNCDADSYAKAYICDNPTVLHDIAPLLTTGEWMLLL